MGWNPNVLASILGDARQYVEQDTREKKAASIKDLDRLYAERQLADQRDYNEEMLLEQQRIAQQNAMKTLRQELLVKSGAYSGMGLTPEQESELTGLYNEQVEAAKVGRLLDEDLVRAKAEDLRRPDAGTQYKPTAGQFMAGIRRQNPLDPTGYDKDWQYQGVVDKFLSSWSSPGGPIKIGLDNKRMNSAFRQVIGTQKDVWNRALNIATADEDKAIPLFKAIKLWESNEAPETIKGKMANIKTTMSNAIQAEYMRQLYQNEDYGQYAPYVSGHLGPHSGRLFDRMVNNMMYIPRTGEIVMDPKAQQQQTGQPTGQQGSAASGEAERNRRLRGRL